MLVFLKLSYYFVLSPLQLGLELDVPLELLLKLVRRLPD